MLYRWALFGSSRLGNCRFLFLFYLLEMMVEREKGRNFYLKAVSLCIGIRLIVFRCDCCNIQKVMTKT